jgi:pimeloyl-ACP methyl ester carboxylesterase
LETHVVELRSGLRLRVVESGPRDGGRVLCVHGWACSAYGFRHVLPALAREGHRAFAVDLKGHGLSDKPVDPGAYTRDAMRDSLLETLDALGIDRVTLVGHSMGGAIAIRAALAAPHRVERLALLAPAGLTTIRYLRIALVGSPPFVAPVTPYLVPRRLIRLILRLSYGRRGRFTERDVDEYWAPSQFPEFARALYTLLHQFDWTPITADEVGAIRVPTLVMFGTLDRLMDGATARRLVDGLPNVRAELIEGAGHLLGDEVPELVNAALVQLLARD